MKIKFQLSRTAYRRWFLAAAVYNGLWGAFTVLFPEVFFGWIGMRAPEYIALWQCIGMLVGVYALGYYLVYRQPERYAALAWVGLIGKLGGLIGMVYAGLAGRLPWAFGLVNFTNDLVWTPVFLSFVLVYGRRPFDSCAAALEQGDDYRP